jgi:hypothetical protein
MHADFRGFMLIREDLRKSAANGFSGAMLESM